MASVLNFDKHRKRQTFVRQQSFGPLSVVKTLCLTLNPNPNPALKYEDGGNRYKSAYMLEDDHLERAGRD